MTLDPFSEGDVYSVSNKAFRERFGSQTQRDELSKESKLLRDKGLRDLYTSFSDPVIQGGNYWNLRWAGQVTWTGKKKCM